MHVFSHFKFIGNVWVNWANTQNCQLWQRWQHSKNISRCHRKVYLLPINSFIWFCLGSKPGNYENLILRLFCNILYIHSYVTNNTKFRNIVHNVLFGCCEEEDHSSFVYIFCKDQQCTAMSQTEWKHADSIRLILATLHLCLYCFKALVKITDTPAVSAVWGTQGVICECTLW